MDIPAGIAAQSFLTRQAIGLEVIRMASDSQKQMANILEEAAESLPKSPVRGARVDFSA